MFNPSRPDDAKVVEVASEWVGIGLILASGLLVLALAAGILLGRVNAVVSTPGAPE